MFEEKDVILEAKHVTRRFPASGGRELTACNDINLKLYKGKTLGLVGESGCGKSTFMRFLVWLDKPTEGEIFYHGKDITKMKGRELHENRQHIQMVFQVTCSKILFIVFQRIQKEGNAFSLFSQNLE